MAAQDALSAFVAKHGQIVAMLDRLKAHADNHLGVDPGTITWGHVANADALAAQLQAISDQLFQEGEFSPEAR